MIEVLVASSILVVIVMMLAMLFQQTSMAWRTGVRRADAFMQIRSLIGSIQRDAAKAVDERSIPEELRDKLGTGSQIFKNGNILAFYTLSASGFKNDNFDDPANPARRSLSFIEYRTDGTRTETILLADGSPEPIPSANVTEFFTGGSGSLDKQITKLEAFNVEWGNSSLTKGLPLSVRLKASVSSWGSSLEIGAASAGPDGKMETKKDNICTWVE